MPASAPRVDPVELERAIRLVSRDRKAPGSQLCVTESSLSGVAGSIRSALVQIKQRDRRHQELLDEQREALDAQKAEHFELRNVIEQLQNQTEDLDDALRAAGAASTAKSQFLANMSHDIRTPMNGILGMAALLSRSELNEKQNGYVRTIVQSGRALLTLINDILDFSKIEAGKLDLDLQPFDLVMCIDDVVAILSPEAVRKGLELRVLTPSDFPGFYVGDVGRIRQILTNIIGNAVKFTDSGSVTIHVDASVSKRNASVMIDVQDTGIGIPEGQIEKMFGEFSQVDSTSTRRHEGTGLGLAICRRLADAMGGSISVRSSLGEGSSFAIKLALPVHCPLAEVTQLPGDLSGRHVVIVGDDQLDGLPLKHQFGGLGVTTTVAEDWLTAVKDLEANPSTPVPALMLLSVNSVSDTAIRHIRGLRTRSDVLATVPVLVLTHLGAQGDAKRLADAGAQGYLSAPLPQGRLSDGLKAVLVQSEGSPSRFVTKYTLAEADNAESGSRAASERVDSGTAKTGREVLLVEDSMVNQEVAREFLEDINCTVTVAGNGREAVEVSGGKRFDLILMDCQMPVMDGFQATLAIRERKDGATNAEVPIVALTANAFSSDKEKCLALGMSAFLAKPFTPTDFEDAVLRWLPDTASRAPGQGVTSDISG